MSFDADDGEPCAAYRRSYRRARKLWTCCACDRAIKPRHVYSYTFFVCDGRVTEFLRCGACEMMYMHLEALCEMHNADPEAVYENGWRQPQEDLGCGLQYADEWGGCPPDEIAALPMMTDDDAGGLLRPGTVASDD